jgi:hypothetical protein
MTIVPGYEFVVIIDSLREFNAVPVEGGEAVVLGIIDPVGMAVVEVMHDDLDEIIESLSALSAICRGWRNDKEN